MTIDYISDLHVDYSGLKLDKYNISHYIASLDVKGEILIIAGDIHEDNEKLVEFLRLLLKLSQYEKIYFVTGNHELYGNRFEDYKDKLCDLRLRLEEHRNLVLLDGQVEEYKGVRIGGCMMWYDGKYMDHFDEDSKEDLDELWRESMPDSRNIAGLETFDGIFPGEISKLESVYRDCQILVTHVPPLCHPDFVSEMFRYSLSSSFYSFEGSRFVEGTSASHWVFGHTHTPMEVELEVEGGVRYLHCNPKGYTSDALSTKVRQIVVG